MIALTCSFVYALSHTLVLAVIMGRLQPTLPSNKLFLVDYGVRCQDH